jgi:hypothetical protein
MQNVLTFAGVLILGIGWMMLLLGAAITSIPEIPGFASIPFAGLPIVEGSVAAMVVGVSLATTGLFLDTRQRSTRRRRPRCDLTPESFIDRRILRIELQDDGRKKYYYEGGKTEIH